MNHEVTGGIYRIHTEQEIQDVAGIRGQIKRIERVMAGGVNATTAFFLPSDRPERTRVGPPAEVMRQGGEGMLDWFYEAEKVQPRLELTDFGTVDATGVRNISKWGELGSLQLHELAGEDGIDKQHLALTLFSLQTMTRVGAKGARWKSGAKAELGWTDGDAEPTGVSFADLRVELPNNLGGVNIPPRGEFTKDVEYSPSLWNFGVGDDFEGWHERVDELADAADRLRSSAVRRKDVGRIFRLAHFSWAGWINARRLLEGTDGTWFDPRTRDAAKEQEEKGKTELQLELQERARRQEEQAYADTQARGLLDGIDLD